MSLSVIHLCFICVMQSLVFGADDPIWDDLRTLYGFGLDPAEQVPDLIVLDREVVAYGHILTSTDVSGIEHVPETGLVGQPTDSYGLAKHDIEEITTFAQSDHPVIQKYAHLFKQGGQIGDRVWWNLYVYRYKD